MGVRNTEESEDEGERVREKEVAERVKEKWEERVRGRKE